MNLIPLPAFQDNHLWILHDGRRTVALDPGDAKPVLACLQRDGLQRKAILVTDDGAGQTAATNMSRPPGARPGGAATPRRDDHSLIGADCRFLFAQKCGRNPVPTSKSAVASRSSATGRTHPYTFARPAVAWAQKPNNNRPVHHRRRPKERHAPRPHTRSCIGTWKAEPATPIQAPAGRYPGHMRRGWHDTRRHRVAVTAAGRQENNESK